MSASQVGFPLPRELLTVEVLFLVPFFLPFPTSRALPLCLTVPLSLCLVVPQVVLLTARLRTVEPVSRALFKLSRTVNKAHGSKLRPAVVKRLREFSQVHPTQEQN
ncbi:hypothetical protein BDQ17DRAFT_1427741 [Cyathus striatus]|nr:hypothetical protein BDQ17DRAFT_1550651 [Cyathus striatus]KAF8999509.1 hypothetical protein BDQ17DRAFT_1427741 [Cyathus striatus]